MSDNKLIFNVLMERRFDVLLLEKEFIEIILEGWNIKILK